MGGEFRIDPVDLPRLKAKYGAGWVSDVARERGAPFDGYVLDSEYDFDFYTDPQDGFLVMAWSKRND